MLALLTFSLLLHSLPLTAPPSLAAAYSSSLSLPTLYSPLCLLPVPAALDRPLLWWVREPWELRVLSHLPAILCLWLLSSSALSLLHPLLRQMRKFSHSPTSISYCRRQSCCSRLSHSPFDYRKTKMLGKKSLAPIIPQVRIGELQPT